MKVEVGWSAAEGELMGKVGRDRLTSMYDTSTVKLKSGSFAFLSSTRTNSSEHVCGMMPLSGPSGYARRGSMSYIRCGDM